MSFVHKRFGDSFEIKKEKLYVTQNMTYHEVFCSPQQYKDTNAMSLIHRSLCNTLVTLHCPILFLKNDPEFFIKFTIFNRFYHLI